MHMIFYLRFLLGVLSLVGVDATHIFFFFSVSFIVRTLGAEN